MTIRQLTIRGFDRDLERKIRQEARTEGISLNRAVLRLLRRGAGLDAPETATGGEGRIGDGLDRFFGTWSAKQTRDLERSVAELRTVDEEQWR